MKSKQLKIIIILVLCSLFSSAYSSECSWKNKCDCRYEKKIDKFDGTISQHYWCNFDEVWNFKENSIFRVLDAKEKVELAQTVFTLSIDDNKEYYGLQILIESETWNSLGAKTAKVLLNGKRWNVHNYSHQTGDIGSEVQEFHFFTYNKQDFKKLLSSKLFEVKVGANLVFSIDMSKLNFEKLEFN